MSHILQHLVSRRRRQRTAQILSNLSNSAYKYIDIEGRGALHIHIAINTPHM